MIGPVARIFKCGGAFRRRARPGKMARPVGRGGQGFGRRAPCAGRRGDRSVKGRAWTFGVLTVAAAVLAGCGGGGSDEGTGPGSGGGRTTTRAGTGGPKLL